VIGGNSGGGRFPRARIYFVLKMKSFLQRYAPAIAWAVLLFALSSIADLAFPVQVFSWDDKIHHAAAYTPLGFLLLRAIAGKERCRPKNLWLAIIIGALYGGSDEIHQYFVPGRFMDWTDALADAIGVTLGSGIFYKWRAYQLSRQPLTQKTVSKNRWRIERDDG